MDTPTVVPAKLVVDDDEWSSSSSSTNGEYEDDLGGIGVVEGVRREYNYDDEFPKVEASEIISSTPVVPVPDDNNTNDPQYTPRCGQFYEHDDRIAYSTSSQESKLDNCYDNNLEDSSIRQYISSKKHNSFTLTNTIESITTTASKKVLDVSTVTATIKETLKISTGRSAKKPKQKFRKSRYDVDSLNKWVHDMYDDEREETHKSRDKLPVSRTYEILDEPGKPQARHNRNYRRDSTAKCTYNSQDTNAQQQKMKLNPKNTSKMYKTSDDPTSRFLTLDNSKSFYSKDSGGDESFSMAKTMSSNCLQQPISLSASQEKNTGVTSTTLHKITKYSSENRSYNPKILHKETPSFRSRIFRGNKAVSQYSNFDQNQYNSNMYFNKRLDFTSLSNKKNQQYHNETQITASKSNSRFNDCYSEHYENENEDIELPTSRPKVQSSKRYSVQCCRKLPETVMNIGGISNIPQTHNQKQKKFVIQEKQEEIQFQQGPLEVQIHQTHNQEQNKLMVLEQQEEIKFQQQALSEIQIQMYHVPPLQMTNNKDQNELMSQEEDIKFQQEPLENNVQNQKKQDKLIIQEQEIQFQRGPLEMQINETHDQEQNELTVQEQQQEIQFQQQAPPEIQILQYNPPLQQIHHSMVFDHRIGMLVMASTDPSMYNHHLYTLPQYHTVGLPSSALSSIINENVIEAAEAHHVLGNQTVVYQSVPINIMGITPPSAGSQSLPYQQSDFFMTTYYPPQLQQQNPPPPRRASKAIPIVAPPPESNLNPSKSNK